RIAHFVKCIRKILYCVEQIMEKMFQDVPLELCDRVGLQILSIVDFVMPSGYQCAGLFSKKDLVNRGLKYICNILSEDNLNSFALLMLTYVAISTFSVRLFDTSLLEIPISPTISTSEMVFFLFESFTGYTAFKIATQASHMGDYARGV
ncbi:hypothetical protein AG4045_027904, partial [Apium graveolens]